MKFTVDTHTHTLFSRHAYSTLEEDVRAAQTVGLELLGVSDHFSDMLFDVASAKNFQYFMNMVVWPREWHGVKLLRACEADIVDLDGHLYGYDHICERDIDGDVRSTYTLQERSFEFCDYVIASIHGKEWTKGATPLELTKMYIAALEHPKVMIIGHAGRSGLDFEWDPVFEAARDLHKCIELNNSTFVSDWSGGRHPVTCRAMAERAAELGCLMSFGSDAHIAVEIGRQDKVGALVEELHIPEELLVCRSADAFLQQLSAAGLDNPFA